MNLVFYRGGSASSSGDDESELDFSYSGPIETGDAADDLATPMSTAATATGHAGPHSLSASFLNASLQSEASRENLGASGLSYLARDDGSALVTETAIAEAEASPILALEEQDTTEPILPVSITAGGVSLNMLLNSATEPVRAEPGNLEPVAELVPLAETSLALAATLWMVPTDSPTAEPAATPLSATTAPASGAETASSLTRFVTGLDRALDQACRAVREEVNSRDHATTGSERDTRDSHELLDWHGPILPAALPSSVSRPARGSRVATPGKTTLVEARNQIAPPVNAGQSNASQSASEDGPRLVLSSLPLLSIASVSTVVAGWLWNKRHHVLHWRRRQELTGQR